MKIHLEKGVEDLRFGMDRPAVKKILGGPNLELTNPDDENEFLWEFTDLKMRLTFYQDEGDKLGYIRSSNRELSFNGTKIIDGKIDKIKKLFDADLDLWEEEIYFWFSSHFFEKYWLTLNTEYGRVTDMELGVPFINENEYGWPQ